MSRFVRNLLIAVGGLYVLAQFVEAYQHVPVFGALSLNPGFHPFAFAWQWLTYPFVEFRGDISLLNVALAIYFAATLFPDVEAAFGRRALVLSIVSGWVLGGVLGTVFSFLFPPVLPASGFFTLVLAALAFALWNRRMSTLQVALIPGRPSGFEITAKQAGLALIALAVLNFLLVREPSHLVVQLGSLLGGLGYAVFRERRAARAIVRHSFTVIRGGKSDRTLH